MARFDYECIECGLVIEIEHSVKDNAVEYKEHIDRLGARPCNGKLKRLISKVLFNFKGGAPTPKHYK